MSYSAQISFKTIDGEDIPDFFVKIKKCCSDNMVELSKDLCFWSPYGKRLVDHKLDRWDLSSKYPGIHAEVDEWSYKVFTYRWFYLKDLKLLGIYGLPKQVDNLFDCKVYFQNSCDQNYDYDEWKGIPIFEEIVDKWKNIPDSYIIEKYGIEKEKESFYIDYYRKTEIYEEIWNLIAFTLDDDDAITYLSLYGRYDQSIIYFRAAVWKNYVDIRTEWEKEDAERKLKNAEISDTPD